ncbi:MAG TPA: hypothetical protein PK303_02430, partial [bacterium]|nr:hypothetical protein [bacterium]HOL35543.1 hypothetical protein [bacterium]HPP07964.1 hypothetical protein [bacterium]
KLLAEEMLINSLPVDITVVDMESFGDFWRKRNQFTFTTKLSNQGKKKKLEIIISSTSIPDKNIGIFIRDGKMIDKILVKDETGRKFKYQALEMTGTSDILIYDIKK